MNLDEARHLVAFAEATAKVDANFRRLAVRAYENVAAWIDANPLEDSGYQRMARFGGWAVPYEDMRSSGPRWSDLLIVFGHSKQNASMGTAPSQGAGRLKVMVFPVLRAPFDTQHIKTRVGGSKHARKIFVHEFVHYLDMRRRKSGLPSSSAKARAGDVVGYFRTPAEFNAYFQDGADKIDDYLTLALKKNKRRTPTTDKLIDIVLADTNPQRFVRYVLKDLGQWFWMPEFVAAAKGTKWERKLAKRLVLLHGYLRQKHQEQHRYAGVIRRMQTSA